MLQYLIRRLLSMIPTMLGITLITFLMINLAPGDPVAMASGGTSLEGGGGGTAKETAAESVKAKKQLLGILRKDLTVRAWRLDGEPAAPAKDAPPPRTLRPRAGETVFADWPKSLAAGSDGRTLAGFGDGEIAELGPDGARLRTLARLTGEVAALARDPVSGRIAGGTTDGTVKVLAADGAEVASAKLPGPIRDLVFLTGGARFLTACYDGRIRVHASEDARIERELKDHTGSVNALAVSPDGRTFWSGGFDRKLRRWDAAEFRVLLTATGHAQPILDIALRADGQRIATGCDDRLVRIYVTECVGDQPPTELRGHAREVTAVAFDSADRVWSGSKDESIRVWDAASGRQVEQCAEATGRVSAILPDAEQGGVRTASDSWVKNSLLSRYWKWLKNICTFDFGNSLTDERPVRDKVIEALPVTMGLNLLAILIIYAISIPVGIKSAVKRGSVFDNATSIALFALSSLPSFWLATMLIINLSSTRGWNILPSVGLHATNADDLAYVPWLGDFGAHLVLPTVVGVYAGFAGLSRYARTSMLETISQDYVRTARAKGLSERVVIYRHALRNSLITIVTLVGTLLPGMVGGSVIVETIFNIHGMGELGFNAISERDYPVIMAVTTMSAGLVLIGTLVSDILYTVVDPRITHS